MKRRIYLDKVYGRLGNHLSRWANLIAFAQEHDVEVWDISRNAKQSFLLFPSLRRKLFPVLNARSRFWHPWFVKFRYSIAKRMREWVNFRCVGRIFNEYKSFPLTLGNVFVDDGNEVILEGFLFRSMDGALWKHAEYVRELFQPDCSVQDVARETLLAVRARAECLVAVHLRRGDYRSWQGGRYFYDLSFYKLQMAKIQTLLAGRSVHFLLFSDDPDLDLNAFSGVSCARSDFAYAQNFDWYLMAHLDYIIGPPSSYSAWASFFGNTPKFVMRSEADVPSSLDDFKVLQYL